MKLLVVVLLSEFEFELTPVLAKCVWNNVSPFEFETILFWFSNDLKQILSLFLSGKIIEFELVYYGLERKSSFGSELSSAVQTVVGSGYPTKDLLTVASASRLPKISIN